MNTITFLNKDTNDISNMVGLALDQYEYTNEQKVRYTFCIEETLLKWQEEFPEDAEVTVKRYDTRSNFYFEISIPGKKVDTLQTNTSKDVLEALVPRIKAGIGNELRYVYQQGINKITLELPKKKVEATLFYRNMWFVTMPIVFQLILLSISSSVDSIMLSYLNQDSMSAASLVSSLTYVFNACIVAFTGAMTSVFGKYWGSRDFDNASGILAHVLKIGFITGLLFTLASIFVPSVIMTLFTDVQSVQVLGIEYMKYMSLYFVFTALSEVLICFMRNAGAVVLSSMFVVIAQIMNIIMNAILIFGLFGIPAMGIKGAAIATMLSSILLFALSLCWFIRKNYIRLKVSHFLHIQKNVRKEYDRIMIPLFFQNVAWFLGNSIISSILGHINADVLAADAIKNTVFNFFSCYKEGSGQASGLLQSTVAGQRQFDKLERNAKYITNFCAVTSGFLALLFALGIPFYSKLFGDVTPRTVEYLNYMMIISIFRLYFSTINNSTNTGMFFIGGDLKVLIIIDNVIKWGLIILPSALGTFAFEMPVYIILTLVNADETLSFPFKQAHRRKGVWLEMAKAAAQK